ncbi:MAG: hypothetical protein ACRCT8_02985 [Lacipirellulaceae bacterium]
MNSSPFGRWGQVAQCCAVAAIALSIASSASAFDNLSGSLPPALPSGVTAGSTYRLGYEMSWFDGVGYRPIRVKFVRPATANKQRVEVKVVVSSQESPSGGPVTSTSRSFAIEPGKSSEGTLLLLPQGNDALAAIECSVDGVSEPMLSMPPGALGMFGRNATQRPDLRLLSPWDTPAQPGSGGPFAWVGGASIRSGTTKSYPALANVLIDEASSELFDTWRAYTSADVLVFDLAELSRMAATDPGEFKAVRAWVFAGGTLWAERVGGRVETLNELGKLLAIDAWWFDRQTPIAQDDDPPADGGAAPPPSGGVATPDAPDPATTARSRPRSVPIAEAPGWVHESLSAGPGTASAGVLGGIATYTGPDFSTLLEAVGPPPTSRGWFASHPMGFGKVQAFQRTAFDAPSSLRERSLAVAGQRWRERGWTARHGVEPGKGHPDFGKMLIPGVGVAPVVEFQMLITLFVLAIGPLNYWLLSRARRLDLLVLTTPLAGAAVTLGLLAYAIVGDGFGTRVRARSLTFLNQPERTAASWSHLSHYAGAAPSDGMVFPDDCAVYPIAPFWETALAAPQRESRAVTWKAGVQRLAPGWLRSRTATQHLVVRSGAYAGSLEFDESAKGLAVRNRLDGDVELLLASPAEGEWRLARGLASSEAATLDPVTIIAATNELRLLFVDNRPEFPLGAGSAIEETLDNFGAAGPMRRLMREASGADLDTNLLNAGIDRIAGLDGGPALDLPPRTYVAITRKRVHTPLGVEGAEEEESFHVTVGRW